MFDFHVPNPNSAAMNSPFSANPANPANSANHDIDVIANPPPEINGRKRKRAWRCSTVKVVDEEKQQCEATSENADLTRCDICRKFYCARCIYSMTLTVPDTISSITCGSCDMFECLPCLTKDPKGDIRACDNCSDEDCSFICSACAHVCDTCGACMCDGCAFSGCCNLDFCNAVCEKAHIDQNGCGNESEVQSPEESEEDAAVEPDSASSGGESEEEVVDVEAPHSPVQYSENSEEEGLSIADSDESSYCDDDDDDDDDNDNAPAAGAAP